MKFTYFKFSNFKGIGNEMLDLKKNPDSKVFTLVGLNESGKTTVLVIAARDLQAELYKDNAGIYCNRY